MGCDSLEEVDALWGALAAEGEERKCGWIKHKHGVSWQIVPKRLVEVLSDPDEGRARRAMEAMRIMRKIEIRAIERAAGGA